LESGIHATIAGVVLGLLTPARPLLDEVHADRIAEALSRDEPVPAEQVRHISFHIRESLPVAERLQELLHPWTSFVVIPLFALANAGVRITGDSLSDAAGSAVTIGIVVGLVVGKALGVAGAIALGQRLGIGRLPDDIGPRHVAGMAALAGIGFTVSLFVAGLAFDDGGLVQEAKLGILAASVVAAAIGVLVLRGAAGGVGGLEEVAPGPHGPDGQGQRRQPAPQPQHVDVEGVAPR
jgi:NhaA family Na+:H+ antiporter